MDNKNLLDLLYRMNGQEEWRIQMLPLQILFLTAWPVIDMRVRCKSQGIGYPPGIPQDITKVVELDIVSPKQKQSLCIELFALNFSCPQAF